MKAMLRFGIVSLITIVAACSAFAQDFASKPGVTARKGLLKTAPLHFDEINIAYEHLHTPNRSLQFGVGYLHTAQVDEGYIIPFNTDAKGFSLKFSHRTYTQHSRFTAPQGKYHGPLVTYRYMVFPSYIREYYQSGVVAHRDRYQLFQQVVSLQYLWGMQRVAWNWLVIDAYLGIGGRVKYAYETGGDPFEDMYSRKLYGYRFKKGSDWEVILGPSVSFNIAVGFVLK